MNIGSGLLFGPPCRLVRETSWFRVRS